MNWYAITGPGISCVTQSWPRVHEIAQMFPYCKYRKFDNEQACWDFVKRYSRKSSSLGMTRYGDTFKDLYVSMRYIIRPDRLYFTYNTKKFGNIRLEDMDNSLVEYRGSVIMVEEPPTSVFNNSTIVSHLKAINRGIEIIGEFIDIDVTVPDHSIYYAITVYSGQNKELQDLRDRIQGRLAEVSFTLRDDWR